MKAKTLQLMQENGIPVPAFTVVEAGQEIDLSFSEAGTFAVRSSFAGEDGKAQSYAGQFETLLSVPRDEVPDAAEKVLASAETANVQAYRGGASAPGGKLRVIIQEMLEPQLSGVLFTVNPAGILNESVLVVGRGAGEGVVRDQVPVTTYFYNRDDKKSMRLQAGD